MTVLPGSYRSSILAGLSLSVVFLAGCKSTAERAEDPRQVAAKAQAVRPVVVVPGRDVDELTRPWTAELPMHDFGQAFCSEKDAWGEQMQPTIGEMMTAALSSKRDSCPKDLNMTHVVFDTDGSGRTAAQLEVLALTNARPRRMTKSIALPHPPSWNAQLARLPQSGKLGLLHSHPTRPIVQFRVLEPATETTACLSEPLALRAGAESPFVASMQADGESVYVWGRDEVSLYTWKFGLDCKLEGARVQDASQLPTHAQYEEHLTVGAETAEFQPQKASSERLQMDQCGEPPLDDPHARSEGSFAIEVDDDTLKIENERTRKTLELAGTPDTRWRAYCANELVLVVLSYEANAPLGELVGLDPSTLERRWTIELMTTPDLTTGDHVVTVDWSLNELSVRGQTDNYRYEESFYNNPGRRAARKVTPR